MSDPHNPKTCLKNTKPTGQSLLVVGVSLKIKIAD
jgi:hypothetical protein